MYSRQMIATGEAGDTEPSIKTYSISLENEMWGR
jgi:hypothetical protein